MKKTRAEAIMLKALKAINSKELRTLIDMSVFGSDVYDVLNSIHVECVAAISVAEEIFKRRP
jgi:hypothetical protein